LGGGSSARECTGFAIGKPISCKIETIIWPSIRKKTVQKQGLSRLPFIAVPAQTATPATAPYLASGCLWANQYR
jgi:hypothetical protein